MNPADILHRIAVYKDAHGGRSPVKGYMSREDAEAWTRVYGFGYEALGYIEWHVDPELKQGRFRLTDGTE